MTLERSRRALVDVSPFENNRMAPPTASLLPIVGRWMVKSRETLILVGHRSERGQAAMHRAAIKLAESELVVMPLEGFYRLNRSATVALDPIGRTRFGFAPLKGIDCAGKMTIASRPITEEIDQSFTTFAVLCDDRGFGKPRFADNPRAPRGRRGRAQILRHLVRRKLRRRPVMISRLIFGAAHG